MLSLLLDRLAGCFDGRQAVVFEGLRHHDKLLLLLADSHRIEARFQHRLVAVFLEAERGDAGLHHEPLVLVRLPPGLVVHPQSVQSLALHLFEVVPERAESDPFELVFSEGSRQDVVAHLLVHGHTEVHPLLESFRQFVRVCLPDESFAALTPETSIFHIVFPHFERSLHIFGAIFGLCVPDGFECLRLRSVHIGCVLLPKAPQIEHLAE